MNQELRDKPNIDWVGVWGVVAGLTNIALLIPAFGALVVSGFIFDAPDSMTDWRNWAGFLGIWLTPLGLIFAAYSGLRAWKTSARKSLIISAVTPIAILIYFFALFLLLDGEQVNSPSASMM